MRAFPRPVGGASKRNGCDAHPFDFGGRPLALGPWQKTSQAPGQVWASPSNCRMGCGGDARIRCGERMGCGNPTCSGLSRMCGGDPWPHRLRRVGCGNPIGCGEWAPAVPWAPGCADPVRCGDPSTLTFPWAAAITSAAAARPHGLRRSHGLPRSHGLRGPGGLRRPHGCNGPSGCADPKGCGGNPGPKSCSDSTESPQGATACEFGLVCPNPAIVLP